MKFVFSIFLLKVLREGRYLGKEAVNAGMKESTRIQPTPGNSNAAEGDKERDKAKGDK